MTQSDAVLRSGFRTHPKFSIAIRDFFRSRSAAFLLQEKRSTATNMFLMTRKVVCARKSSSMDSARSHRLYRWPESLSILPQQPIVLSGSTGLIYKPLLHDARQLRGIFLLSQEGRRQIRRDSFSRSRGLLWRPSESFLRNESLSSRSRFYAGSWRAC